MKLAISNFMLIKAVDLTSFVHKTFELKQQVDFIHTDFNKAFNFIDHHSLIYILDRLEVGKLLLSWLISYGNERRKLWNTSDCFQALSIVPQCSHLGPMLFNIYINTVYFFFFPMPSSTFCWWCKAIKHCMQFISGWLPSTTSCFE